MTWQEAIATIVILLGLGAGAYLVAQRPAFWIEFGRRLIASAWPAVWKYVSKRMSPELEAEMHKCIRRGGEWDNFRKRCRDRK
jgi:hypothetical protein